MDGFSPLARFAKRWHLPCRYLTAVINGEDKTGLRAVLPQQTACLSAKLLPNLKLPSR